MCSSIFEYVLHVPKSCKLDIFILFSFFFLLNRIMSVEMLHVFQRLASNHGTPAGDSLEYQNIPTRYNFFSPPRFLKTDSVHQWFVFELQKMLGAKQKYVKH